MLRASQIRVVDDPAAVAMTVQAAAQKYKVSQQKIYGWVTSWRVPVVAVVPPNAGDGGYRYRILVDGRAVKACADMDAVSRAKRGGRRFRPRSAQAARCHPRAPKAAPAVRAADLEVIGAPPVLYGLLTESDRQELTRRQVIRDTRRAFPCSAAA